MSAMVEIEVQNSWDAQKGSSWVETYGHKAVFALNRADAEAVRDYLEGCDDPIFWHVENDESDLYEQELGFNEFSKILKDTGLSEYLTPYPEAWPEVRSVVITVAG